MTLRSETKIKSKATRKAKPCDPGQLGLFDQPRASPPAIDAAPASIVARRAMPAPSRQANEFHAMALTIEDMPDYPAHLVASVEQSIRDAPTDRVLLTYRDIQDFFGVSRATVARRMKEGLVPGIRLLHGRVLDDGPVRRLDRTQVKWLLLAVRVRHGAGA